MKQYTYYTIYEITNTINNHTYVGQHATYDLEDNYMGSGRALNDAYDKYGRAHFTKKILHTYDNFEEMNAKEIELVTRDYILLETTYNLMIGGSVNDGKSSTHGTIPVKDDDGVFSFVSVDDPRYRSGELKNVNTGRIKVIDAKGDNRYVEPDDPRIESGEVTMPPKYVKVKHKQIRINKDGVQKVITVNMLSKWEAKGWVKGSIHALKPKLILSTTTIWVNKDGLDKRVIERNISKWEAKGWKLGTAASVKGPTNHSTLRTLMIKDGTTKQIRLYRVPSWEAKGWVVKPGCQR
jgi:hypothetical protein